MEKGAKVRVLASTVGVKKGTIGTYVKSMPQGSGIGRTLHRVLLDTGGEIILFDDEFEVINEAA